MIQTLYHISPVKNRDSIIKNGLKLNAGERARRFGQTEERIYLVDRLYKVIKLIDSSMWNTHPDFKEGFDIFQVHEDVDVYQDEKLDYGLYTKTEINKIELVTTLENKQIHNTNKF